MSDRPYDLLAVSHAREIGGAESNFGELMKASQRVGRVDLVCRTDIALDSWCRDLERAGIAVHRVDLGRPADVRRLAGLAARAGLVHLNLSHPAGKYQLAAALVARSMRRPMLITHHLAIEMEQLGIAPLWAISMRVLARLATTHVALSTSAREVLVRHYGCRPSDVVVSPAFVDTASYRPLEPGLRDQARAELARVAGRSGWPAGARVILTVSRLNRQKGLLDLLDVASVTAASEPGWTFVIAGDGELRSMLSDEIVSRGLQERVLLAGPQPRERIRVWLGAADVFFLPSHFEGVPIAVLEAVASGCPVVATEVGGVPDLGLRPPFGCTAPAGVTEHLARALTGAMAWPRPDNPHERARLLAPYERDRCIATILGLQRQLAAGGAAAPQR